MILENPAGQAVFRHDKMGKADLARGEKLFCGLNTFEPGQRHEAHVHADQDKLYVVLEGVADVSVGGDKRRVAPGGVALAVAGERHGIENAGSERLIVLVVMSPPPPAR